MICKKCNARIPDDAKFCPACGAAVLDNQSEEQQKMKYCPQCGTKIPEGESSCPKCEKQESNPVGIESSKNNEVKVTPKNRKIIKIIVGIVLFLLFICSDLFRSMVNLLAIFAVPVLLVIFVICAIRKKPKKKWGIAFLAALAVVLIFTNSTAGSKDAIVGEWELSFVSFFGEDFVPAEDIDMDMSYIVKKDGTAELIRSGNNPILHSWTYDKERTESLNDAKSGSKPTYTYSAYSITAETEDGSNVTNFKATVYENTLMITSYADGEEVATLAFDRAE